MAIVPAAIPIILDIAVRFFNGGGHIEVVDPANLAFCGFSVTLAAFARILGHGNGRRMIPFLFGLATLQIVFALLYSGTFSQPLAEPLSMAELNELARVLQSDEPQLNSAQILLARHAVEILQSQPPMAKLSAKFILGVTSLIAGFVLLRFWSPAQIQGEQQDNG